MAPPISQAEWAHQLDVRVPPPGSPIGARMPGPDWDSRFVPSGTGARSRSGRACMAQSGTRGSSQVGLAVDPEVGRAMRPRHPAGSRMRPRRIPSTVSSGWRGRGWSGVSARTRIAAGPWRDRSVAGGGSARRPDGQVHDREQVDGPVGRCREAQRRERRKSARRSGGQVHDREPVNGLPYWRGAPVAARCGRQASAFVRHFDQGLGSSRRRRVHGDPTAKCTTVTR